MKDWKSVVSLGMGCFLLTCLYFTSLALSYGYDGEVRVINLATEPVKNGELEVCDQQFQLGGIDKGKSKLFRYKVRSDSHFRLIVEFNSGRKLTRELGYVTSGRDFKHTLTLKDGEVLLTLLP